MANDALSKITEIYNNAVGGNPADSAAAYTGGSQNALDNIRSIYDSALQEAAHPFLGWAKKYSEVTKGIDDYWKGIGSGFTKDYSGGRGSELDSLIDGWDAVKDEASVYGYGDEYVNALRDIRSRIEEANERMAPFIDEVDYNIRGRGFGYTGDSMVDTENAADRERTFQQAQERADAYTAQRNRVQMLQDEMTRTASMPTDYRTFMAMEDYRSQLESARKELADMEAKGYADAQRYVAQYQRNQGVLDSYKDFAGESSRTAEGSDVLGDFLKLSTEEVASALAAEEAGKNGLPAFDVNSAIVQRAKAGSWDKLSDAEIDIYYNVLNTQGQDAAMEYLDRMKTILSKRSTKEATITEDTLKALRAAVPEIDEDDSAGVAMGKAFAMLGAGIVAPVILSAVSVPTKIAGSAPAFISDFINTVQGKDINPYDEMHMAQNMAGSIRSAIAGDINTTTGASEDDFITWGDVYQAVMSSADSLLGSTIGGSAYGVLMGMDAASSTARELYESGADRGQIIWGSLLAGTAEMVFEKWSLDKFTEDILSKGANSWKQVIRNVLLQGGVEASEEVFTELANTISDALIQRSGSQWETDIREYLKEHPEASRAQAIGNAIANAAVKVGQAGAGGFISGAGMGISGSRTGFNNNVGDGQTVIDTGSIQEVLDTALELDPKNSEAKRLKAKLKDGALPPTEQTRLQKIVSKALSLQESPAGISSRDLAGLGQLWNENIQGIAKQDAAKVASATKARLEALGESGNIELLARILTKEAVGESLNPFEAAIVKNSKYGVRVQNELRPDAIRSGNFDTAWAEQIGTDNLNMQEYNRMVEDAEESEGTEGARAEEAESPTEAQEAENEEDDFPDNPLDALTEDELRASRAAESGNNQSEGSTDVQGVQLPWLDEEGNTVYDDNQNTINGGQPNGTESLSGGDRGRNAGERAGGQAGADAEAQGRPRATFFRNNQAAARRSLADVPDSGWQEVTPKSIGIKNGSDTKAFRVIPESAYDGELRSTAERIYQETGATVVFTVDGMQLKGRDGDTVYVRGARIGNTIYVQADHPLVTATQIADHEAFHAKANRNGAEMIDRLAERIASMDKDAFDRVVDKYAKALEAIYDASDYDAFMRIVAEEMLADAYSGINAFGAHAEQFGDTVNKWMDEHFIGKKSEAEMEQLRGPPEGQRFSADDYDYQDFSWAVNDGILSPLELRKVESAVAETVAQGYNSHSFNDALSIATIDGTKAALFHGSMEQPVIDYVIQCDTGIDQDEILLVKEYIDYARDGEPKRILESLYDEQGIRIFDRGNRGFLERETGGREGDIGQTSNQGYQGRENQVSNAKRRYGPTQAEVDESLERMRATIREEEGKQNFSVDDAMDSDGNQLTAQQAEYFADSKIRDEDGNLRVVYHGTDADFTVFDRSRARANMDIAGNFFSPWQDDAMGYGQNVGAYYLNIVNPAPESAAYRALRMYQGQNGAGIKARDYLIEQGYDGVNNSDEEYIAFFPEQIKRISNNAPTSNEDIRFSVNDSQAQERNPEQGQAKTTADSRNRSSVRQKVKATYAKNNLRAKVQTIFSIQPGNRSVANDMINDVTDRYLRNGYITEEDRQNLFDRLVEMGTVTVPAEESYREAREYLRGSKIYVEPSVIADFGDDWADVRRRAFGAGIYLTTSRTDSQGNPIPGIDSWNHALATDVPGVFDSEETDARKMLEDILLAAEEGKAENVSLAEYTARIAGMQHVPEDEMWLGIERQLDNALQSFAESADIELRLRERTEKQLRADAQKRKDAALEARERKDLQELRRKTQKSLQWLNRNRNRAPEDLRPAFDALLSDIDIIAMGAAKAARLSKDGEHTWQELAQIYKDAKENDPNWLPSTELEKIIMRLDTRKINDMDIGALNNLLKAALGLQTELQNRNKLLNDTQHRYISEVSKDSRREIEQAKGGYTGKAWDKFFNADSLSHVNRLERMVGWNKNSEFYSLVKQLEDGERNMRRYEVEARQMLADFATENEEWLRTADGQGKDGQWIEVEFPELMESRMGDKPIFGGTVKVAMTPLQRVHMALEAENYDNLRHMTGGRTFADRELYSNGQREEAYAHGKTIRMAPETVQMLVRDLSDEEKQLYDILKRYYNEFSTGRINQVSNVLYGYDRAMGHFYAPIFTNENFNATDFGIFDVTAEGVGNLKERKASYTPTLNIGALDAFEKHMRNTSRFVGMAIPARNWANYMNYRDQNTSNKDVIAQKWGKESVDHIENLLTTLQGGGPLEVKPGAGQLVDKLFSNYISAVFGVNPGIILKQAGSIPLAGAYLGFENLPSVTQIKEFDYEAFDKYSKDLTYRGLGYALPETKTLKENPGWWERNKAFQFLAGGGAITAMDKAAASVLVPWAYNKVAAENPELLASTTQEQIDNGTSEFWKKVAEEFEDACSRSQSNHQIVNSTDMRDSKNAIVRAFTMFRTDSAQTYNAIRQLVGEAQYEMEHGNAESIDKAKKKAGSAVLAAVVGFSWAELIDLLMKLWKHKDRKYRDDDGNLTAASVAGEMARGLIGDMAGVVAGGEELVDILGNILTGEKWYGISAPGLEQVNDMLETIMQSGSSMRELIKGATDVIANDGDLGRYFSDHSGEIAGGIKNVAETAAVYLAGLPVQNLEAYMLGLVKTVSPELGQAYDDMWGRVTRSGLKGLEGDVLSGRIDRLLESRGLEVDDAVSKELGALYEAGFTGAVPGDIPASVSVNGESVSLGEADKQRYSDAWNEAVGNTLEDLIAQDAYRNASEEERAKIIRKVFDYATEIAKSRTVEGFELSKSAQDNSRLIEQGVSVADVMSFSALASDMDSGAKAELLMSMPINPANKEAIYRVKVSDKYDEEIKEAKAAGLSFDEFLRMKSAGLSTSREGKYIEAVKAGFDADKAFSMSEVLAALPKNSKDIVKWRACVDQFGGVQDRLLALSMVMTESQYLPVRVAAEMGVDPEHYIQAMEYRPNWDTNRNGSFSNAEYTAGLQAMRIPTKEKAILWQLFCSSSKAKKNPFDKGVGAEVVQQRTEAKAEQGSKAAQTGAQASGGADYDEDIAAAIRRQLMG